MNIERTRQWGLADGLAVCCMWVVIGQILQWTIGPVAWSAMAWPVNAVVLALLLFFLFAMHVCRRRVYLFRWMATLSAGIPALVAAAMLTVLMGVTRQVPEGHPAVDPFGITDMLSYWPFVLVYLWLTVLVGMVSLTRLARPSLRSIPFLLNHLGIFIALVAGTLGNADMQRLKMTTQVGLTEWRAMDRHHRVLELPVAVELHRFSIDEYPPKLLCIDNETGEMTDEGGWQLQQVEVLDEAAPTGNGDSGYVEWHGVGATSAIRVHAVRGSEQKDGWVSCGSYAFPSCGMALDAERVLVMPTREPRSYSSDVTIHTESGKTMRDTISVNKPLSIDGWKIYQFSYDESKGRWSDISILELVRDPWLPYVYAGIFMMLFGAVCMFVIPKGSPRKGEDERG